MIQNEQVHMHIPVLGITASIIQTLGN